MVQLLGKTVCQFLPKLNIVKILGIMFKAALLIISNKQKQPRCPLIGEWINYETSIQWNVI